MLTDKEVFKDLWTWLAAHPDSFKKGWPGWDVFNFHAIYVDYELCPACRTGELRSIAAATGSTFRFNKCNYCPLMKSASESKYYEPSVFCLGGLFVRWLSHDRVTPEDLEQRKLIAEAIRDLTWEDKADENDNDGVQGKTDGVLPS